MLPAEIKSLDPSRNASRLKLEQFELTGPYFPGRLLGDRVLAVRAPRTAQRRRPRWQTRTPTRRPASLLRTIEKSTQRAPRVLAAILPSMCRADEYERQKHNKEWVVEFPAAALRVL